MLFFLVDTCALNTVSSQLTRYISTGNDVNCYPHDE